MNDADWCPLKTPPPSLYKRLMAKWRKASKYRVVEGRYCGYQADWKPWGFPFWLQCYYVNTSESEEGARAMASRHQRVLDQSPSNREILHEVSEKLKKRTSELESASANPDEPQE